MSFCLTGVTGDISGKIHPLVADTWNDELWLGLVDHATVHSDGSITFKFKNGTEITVGAE